MSQPNDNTRWCSQTKCAQRARFVDSQGVAYCSAEHVPREPHQKVVVAEESNEETIRVDQKSIISHCLSYHPEITRRLAVDRVSGDYLLPKSVHSLISGHLHSLSMVGPKRRLDDESSPKVSEPKRQAEDPDATQPMHGSTPPSSDSEPSVRSPLPHELGYYGAQPSLGYWETLEYMQNQAKQQAGASDDADKPPASPEYYPQSYPSPLAASSGSPAASPNFHLSPMSPSYAPIDIDDDEEESDMSQDQIEHIFRLPPEVVNLIMAHLHQRDLMAIAQTSRSGKELAQRFLIAHYQKSKKDADETAIRMAVAGDVHYLIWMHNERVVNIFDAPIYAHEPGTPSALISGIGLRRVFPYQQSALAVLLSPSVVAANPSIVSLAIEFVQSNVKMFDDNSGLRHRFMSSLVTCRVSVPEIYELLFSVSVAPWTSAFGSLVWRTENDFAANSAVRRRLLELLGIFDTKTWNRVLESRWERFRKTARSELALKETLLDSLLAWVVIRLNAIDQLSEIVFSNRDLDTVINLMEASIKTARVDILRFVSIGTIVANCENEQSLLHFLSKKKGRDNGLETYTEGDVSKTIKLCLEAYSQTFGVHTHWSIQRTLHGNRSLSGRRRFEILFNVYFPSFVFVRFFRKNSSAFLREAVRTTELDLVSFFIDHGCLPSLDTDTMGPIEHRDFVIGGEGRGDALAMAMRHADEEMCRLLLSRGASPKPMGVKTVNRVLAMHWRASSSLKQKQVYLRLITLFTSYGVAPNAVGFAKEPDVQRAIDAGLALLNSSDRSPRVVSVRIPARTINRVEDLSFEEARQIRNDLLYSRENQWRAVSLNKALGLTTDNALGKSIVSALFDNL